MELTLEEIKDYLRIDGNIDNIMLEGLKGAAEEYLEGAGVNEDYSRLTYKLVVLMIIAHWYTNRGVVQENKSTEELPYGVRSLVQQLQYCEVIT